MDTDFDVQQRRASGETELNEDSLRQALERLGGGRGRRSRNTNDQDQGPAVQKRVQQRMPSPEGRRRRFVQDGQVVVEHHQTSRYAQRAGAVQQDEHEEDIARLRQLLKAEQRRAEDAGRQTHDMQTHVRSVETHLEHARLHIRELEGTLRNRDETIHELNARLHALAAESERQLQEARSEVKKSRRVRVEVAPQPAADQAEPEPVQWWKD